jgi:archaellum component FlaC
MYADKQQFNPMGYAHGGGGAMAGGLGAVAGHGASLGETSLRQPEVMGEMDRLQKQVEALAMVSEVLANRLNPIRSQCGSGQAGNQQSAPEPVLCGVAASIRTYRQRLEMIHAELQRALNELEI